MIISRTPVRLSFFGGGTDYREYFFRNSGAVLGSTINKYIYVSVNELSDFFQYKIRVGYSKAELVERVDDIVHPSVRECLKFKNITGNLDIHIFADLPARTGLGSSSAFTVGFLNALYAMEGKLVIKQKLAEDAIFVEQQLIKENVGCQDQMHCAYGGMNIIEFDQNRISVRPVIISREKLHALNSSLMVFYTGQTRYATRILSEQIENTKNGDKDAYLARMYLMVFEAERTISDEPIETMLRKLGELLHEGWQLKKSLSSRITTPQIDATYEKAMAAGAYGGKLAGAGGGGFLFFIVPPERQRAVREAMQGMLEVDLRFDNEGSKIIYIVN